MVIERFGKIPVVAGRREYLARRVRVQSGGGHGEVGTSPYGAVLEVAQSTHPCCLATCPYLLCERLRWPCGARSHLSFGGGASGLQRCVRHGSCPSRGAQSSCGVGGREGEEHTDKNIQFVKW